MTASHPSGEPAPPVLCCDLDGVLWRGAEPVPGGAAAVAAAVEAGWRVGFLTNNSAAPVGTVVDRLRGLGIHCRADDVITSAQAAAGLLERSLAPGARVLVVGGPGVDEALVGAGLVPVDAPPAAAVVVGWDREFDFVRLDRASRAVRDGALFVATNRDPTYPAEGRLLPGAGAMVAAVEIAAGTGPVVAGKPESAAVDLVRRRFGAHGVVVGDRPSTDGALATALGWPFALVLSGVASAAPGRGGEEIPRPEPAYVAADLAALVPRLRSHRGPPGGGPDR